MRKQSGWSNQTLIAGEGQTYEAGLFKRASVIDQQLGGPSLSSR